MFFLFPLLLLPNSLIAGTFQLGDADQIEAASQMEQLRGDISFASARAATAWTPVKDETPNYGFTDQVIWLRTSVESEEIAERVLHVDIVNLNLKVYVIRDGEVSSYDLTLDARSKIAEGRYRAIVLPMTFPKGKTDLYFRIASEDTLNFPLQIFKKGAFEAYRERATALYFAYFGAMLVMALYNFFVYLSTRENAYRWYILYTISALVYFVSQSGYLMQFVGSITPFWILRANALLAGFYLATCVAFTRSFLRTPKTLPFVDKLFLLQIGLGMISVLGSAFPQVPFALIGAVESLTGLAVVLSMLGAGIYLWR